jgi:membrane protein implicated in regulation of membrane protease activity
MEQYLWWGIVGIALIIAELLTGTFYLLVIGIAAIAGCAVSYFGYSFWVQAVTASAIAAVGVILVGQYRPGRRMVPGSALDVGQSVVFQSWTSEADRMARVHYRDALWDAKVMDAQTMDAGKVLYICGIEGSTLRVAANKQA